MTLRQDNKELYWAWKSMKQRCLNPKNRAYRNYGARGIGICDAWLEFEPFLEWGLENGYMKGLELDRTNNDGDYCPENCRWVSRRENVNNRRKTTLLTVCGRTQARTDWERELALPSGIVKSWVTTSGIDYAQQRLEEVIAYGYTKKDFSRNHETKPVECVETGEVFDSIKKAARGLGLNSGNVWRVANKGGSTGGYHFRLI